MSLKNERVSPRPDAYSYEDERASATSQWKVTTAKFVDKKKSKAVEHSSGQRNSIMKGLPENPTLFDVVKVVRGGQLLNVYIRHKERLAHVSFVDASVAASFLVYSKGAAVSVLGKRVVLTSHAPARRSPW
jgi:hypothetical protein